jgi:hypothetical protein
LFERIFASKCQAAMITQAPQHANGARFGRGTARRFAVFREEDHAHRVRGENPEAGRMRRGSAFVSSARVHWPRYVLPSLWEAAQQGRTADVEALVRDVATGLAEPQRRACVRAALAIAVINDHVECASSLISTARVPARDLGCLVRMSARYGGVSMVAMLVRVHGADVNAVHSDTGRSSALHLAAAPEVVHVLLEAKARLEARACDYSTPLLCAVRRGDAAVVGALVAVKARVNADTADDSPLVSATGPSKNLAVVTLLLAAKAGVNDPVCDGCTPLHSAACWCNAAIVEHLIGARACVDALAGMYGSASRQYTPLDMARLHATTQRCRAVQVLVAAEAARTHSGQ